MVCRDSFSNIEDRCFEVECVQGFDHFRGSTKCEEFFHCSRYWSLFNYVDEKTDVVKSMYVRIDCKIFVTLSAAFILILVDFLKELTSSFHYFSS